MALRHALRQLIDIRPEEGRSLSKTGSLIFREKRTRVNSVNIGRQVSTGPHETSVPVIQLRGGEIVTNLAGGY